MGLKGAQIPKFCIFQSCIEFLFPAWFDLAVMVFEIKSVKGSQIRSTSKMCTFLFKVVFECSFILKSYLYAVFSIEFLNIPVWHVATDLL